MAEATAAKHTERHRRFSQRAQYDQGSSFRSANLWRWRMISVDNYLNFPGNALEAFEFYRSVFGGEFEQHFRYEDYGGDSGFDPADTGRTAHVSLRLTDSYVLMGSDVPKRAEENLRPGTNAYINLNVGDEEEANRLFEGLSAGGQVESPLDKTAWSALYGSLTDRFGVRWMVNYWVA